MGWAYSSMIIIITNVAPYSLSSTCRTGECIVELIQKFSTISWLEQGPNSFTLLNLIIDMVNNMIQYQWKGSQPVLLSMIRRKSVFEQLQ
jgi:hypothetical protein